MSSRGSARDLKRLSNILPSLHPTGAAPPVAPHLPTPYHPIMSRKTGYQAKLTTPEEAAGVVKSGDLVYIPAPPHPQALIQSLADRRDELHDVKGLYRQPRLRSRLAPTRLGRFLLHRHRAVPGPGNRRLQRPSYRLLTSPQYNPYPQPHRKGRPQEPIDVIFILVSPPDANGFCSFGYAPMGQGQVGEPLQGCPRPGRRELRSEPMGPTTSTSTTLT